MEPVGAAGVELIGPDARDFRERVASLMGRPLDDVVKAALPWSVIAINNRGRAVALLGIRFDMAGPGAKNYSVIHYADTLRHPENAAILPGASRFVCAEPLYTDLVLRRGRHIDARGPMNLENLRRIRSLRASVDCVALDDGQFAGPDSLGAFARFENERQAEAALLEQLLGGGAEVETLLRQASEIPGAAQQDRPLLAPRVLARKLFDGMQTGGLDEVLSRARDHRLRIPLWRAAELR